MKGREWRSKKRLEILEISHVTGHVAPEWQKDEPWLTR